MSGSVAPEGALPRAYLPYCLLLLLAEGAGHGYDLLVQVRALGVRSAEAGGLYRALRAMEHDGQVRSWWEPSQSGPPRRTYELTDQGRTALDEAAAILAGVRDLLDSFLARHRSVVVTDGADVGGEA